MKTFSKIVLFALSTSLTACVTTPPQNDGRAPDEGAAIDTAPGLNKQGMNADPLDPSSTTGVEIYSADGQRISGNDPLNGMSSVDIQEGDSMQNKMDPNSPFQPVIYFGYDQYELSPEAMETIQHYANQLIANPWQTAILQGHTDERGTPDYNLALGEKRAQTVKNAMIVLGIKTDRLEVISMGEEMPAVQGNNEAAWAKNRRVEIKIKY